MLTQDDNETLCRVGPGTLMGNLLRRYWTAGAALGRGAGAGQPAGARAAAGRRPRRLPRHRRRASVSFAQACPHRGASLFFGRNEEDGLRCVYHGWKFDATGACVDMPSEPAESQLQEQGARHGLPDARVRRHRLDLHGPAGDDDAASATSARTPLPREQWRAAKLLVDCNWVQAMEGNLDTAHISWLHQFHGAPDIPDDGTDAPGYPSNAMSIRIWAHDRAPRLEVRTTGTAIATPACAPRQTATPTSA